MITDIETEAAVISKVREEMNRLRGRMFGTIEAVGFPPRRETAIKNLVRTVTYDAQANLEAAVRGER